MINNSTNVSLRFYFLNIFWLLQIREARKQEQAMNPHYLKTSDFAADIPVASIDLPVPLKIPGNFTII